MMCDLSIHISNQDWSKRAHVDQGPVVKGNRAYLPITASEMDGAWKLKHVCEPLFSRHSSVVQDFTQIIIGVNTSLLAKNWKYTFFSKYKLLVLLIKFNSATNTGQQRLSLLHWPSACFEPQYNLTQFRMISGIRDREGIHPASQEEWVSTIQ